MHYQPLYGETQIKMAFRPSIRCTARTIRLYLVIVVCVWTVTMLYMSRRKVNFFNDFVTEKILATFSGNYFTTLPYHSNYSNSGGVC